MGHPKGGVVLPLLLLENVADDVEDRGVLPGDCTLAAAGEGC